MLNKSRAIVLHHIRFGESSLIVTFYTEKLGKLVCLVNGVRLKKAKFPATFFQPLSLLEADFYYRENRELQRLKEATCPCLFATIPFQITKSAIAMFLAEVLYLTLREEESNPPLFSFLFHSFQLLDNKDKGIANFHLWFMLQFARYLGILTAEAEFFEGNKTSPDLRLFYQIPQEATAALIRMIGSPQGPPDDLKLSNQNRNLLLDRIIRHYAAHVDGFSRLKSFTVLKEVFE